MYMVCGIETIDTRQEVWYMRKIESPDSELSTNTILDGGNQDERR
jgi:hypothetical protein